MEKRKWVKKETPYCLFKQSEIAEHFGMPRPTVYNWSISSDTDWRRKHYLMLEKIYANHLAELAGSM
jgi:hypothetical protein